MRADVLAAQTGAAVQFSGGGTQYLIQTPAGVLYLVYNDSLQDLAFKKSTDGGLSWSPPTVLFTGTLTALSVWYDRWSGISGDLIHCAYIESATDDVLYRSIDAASSDALSTQTTIFDGASTAAGGCLSISRARGGNLGCYFAIDAGAEDGYAKSTDVGATWSAAADPSEASTQDQVILLPGWAADNQDMMLIFWDASANEISRKLYDDSADSWAETSIATSMNDQPAATAFPHFDAVVDIANSRNVLIAWNGVDAANADLQAWTITESAITALTDVVTNGTDDQGLAALGIATDTGYWYAMYAGKSDGSEDFLTATHIYYKVSKDSGTTWGPETQLTRAALAYKWLITAPRFTGPFVAAFHNDIALDELLVSVSIDRPRARMLIGV